MNNYRSRFRVGKIGNSNAGNPPKKADDMGRSVPYCLSGTERKEGLYSVSTFSRVPRLSKATPRNTFAFVKKLPKKNGNFVLALRKRLFCNAKPTLLPCKTAAFGM